MCLMTPCTTQPRAYISLPLSLQVCFLFLKPNLHRIIYDVSSDNLLQESYFVFYEGALNLWDVIEIPLLICFAFQFLYSTVLKYQPL